MLLQTEEVRRITEAALLGAGVPARHAALQADLLIEAELRGISSHGLLRLERIVARIGNGVANPLTTGRQTWRGAAFLAVDGEMGLGPVVAMAAVEAIAAKARHTGIGVAAIANSNHIGMLAYYIEKVAADGQLAIAMTTSEALVYPWGGRRALIGTNPIAIGVPTATGPFAVDLATSLVSMGEIHDFADRGIPLPTGWAVDRNGQTTTDAEAAKSGAIAPFGGAKGYALGLALEILVSSLTGAALGRDIVGTLDTDRPCNKGDVFIVIDAGSEQAGAVSRYLDIIRQTPPAAGFDRVLIPNERATRVRAERLVTGLRVADELWATVRRLGGEPTTGVRP